MSRNKHWELPIEIWDVMEGLLPKNDNDPQKGGRPPVNLFRVAKGIFYVLSTGIQWKALPSEYGSASTVHRYFQKWTKHGVFSSLWREGLIEYDEEKKLKLNGKALIPQQSKRHLVESIQVQTQPIGVSLEQRDQ
jgi:transposase